MRWRRWNKFKRHAVRNFSTTATTRRTMFSLRGTWRAYIKLHGNGQRVSTPSGTFLVLIGNTINQHAGFKSKVFPLQTSSLFSNDSLKEGAKYSTRIEQAAYSALNRRRDQSCHLKAE
ncbi:hypothetical protein V1478_002777 [Vespula squamosa]|uniref:Uncharacterized protein n=1 Tax=Vespula squamosa TaxID=30214 RepID=A0ABD2BSC8_VESSQ